MNKHVSKKNLVFVAIMIVEIIAMLAVYPGGIIRRDTRISSGGAHDYAYTSPMGTGDVFTQSFTALGDKLKEHSFAVKRIDELSSDWVLLYELKSPDGTVIYSQSFTGDEITESGFRTVELNLSLNKGQEYSYTLSVIRGSGEVCVTCTPYPEDFTPGMVSSSQNGSVLTVHAFNQFVYRQKLNIKNVIFTWLFLLILGAGLIAVFTGEVFKIPDKFSNLLKKTGIQNITLVVEIIISVLIFSSLTGGQGVDFDEAFSWDVIVNNNITGILDATAADVHPPLYYLIVKGLFSVFGESIKVMVWTSIIPVILGMILSSVFVKKRWGFGVAIIFNIAYAFAPFMLHYGLDLRMYSWMNLFILGVILISYEISTDSKKWHFSALFAFSILAVYTQYFALFPIVVCYLWIFILLLRKNDRKGFLRFIIVGILDIIAYLPWLFYGTGNMGIVSGSPQEGYEFYFSPSLIFKTLFQSNLENGEVMAGILFVVAILLFVLQRKKYLSTEKSFMVMLFVNVIFCWYFTQWLGSLNGHFFHPRYVIFCLFFVWLLFTIVFARSGLSVYVLFSFWTIELCFSSYLVEKAYEYETTPLMPKTVAFIDAEVDPDAVIVYDYAPDFKLIWQYYMPGHEFVHFDDLNLEEMRGQTFWVINLSGAHFTQEEIDEYSLTIEHNPEMGFMGMERFDLWKVTVG